MDTLKNLEEAVGAAFAEFKKEYGEDVKLEDGDEFVTVFNNAVLIMGVEGNTLNTKFIGGKPYQVDMTLAIYEGDSGQLPIT